MTGCRAPGCASWSATARPASRWRRSCAALVKARKNLLISGGTAVGKTTMLRALASAIPPDERLITIEDSLELCLDWDTAAHPDVVAMQSREPNTEGEGEITLAELVRWALRMTPDRVLVGEVRGAEVIPMLNAMSQGNDGSMTTIHASSSRGAMLKLAAYAAQSPEHLTLEDTGLLIAGAIHFVIQLAWDAERGAVRVQHPGDHRRRRPAGGQQRGVVSRPGPPRRPGGAGPRRHHGGTRGRRLPARTVAGGVSAAAAGILGALAGLGVILLIAGLRRTGTPQPGPRLARLAGRARQEATMPRVAGTLVTAAVVAAVTRWQAGTVLAGLAAWFLPRVLGPDRGARAGAGADRGDRLVHRDAAGHDLPPRPGWSRPSWPPASRCRPRRSASTWCCWHTGDPSAGSGCPPRCARSPPRPPTRPPTLVTAALLLAAEQQAATWPSCWAAWPIRPASTR